MKREDVPQDESSTLAGQKKPLYVLNETGQYTTALSSGWDAEEVVLNQAIAQFETQTRDALLRARHGVVSPLEYHMYRCRMDLTVLAQSTGFFKWQVKRHLRPDIFQRLPEKKLVRYAEALGLSITDLQALPEQ
jgi:hypothetical protein